MLLADEGSVCVAGAVMEGRVLVPTEDDAVFVASVWLSGRPFSPGDWRLGEPLPGAL